MPDPSPPEPPSEPQSHAFEALIKRAQAGDQEAFRLIYLQYSPIMYLAIHGRISPVLRGRFETEEVMQSAFAAMIEDLPRFEYRGRPAFEAWLRQIAGNKLRQTCRTHRAARRDARLEKHPEDKHALSSDDSTPSRILGELEIQTRIVQTFNDLPEKLREIIERKFSRTQSTAEIAKDLGCSERTVARRINDALRAIEALIEKQDLPERP